jgi:hypothetical protein
MQPSKNAQREVVSLGEATRVGARHGLPPPAARRPPPARDRFGCAVAPAADALERAVRLAGCVVIEQFERCEIVREAAGLREPSERAQRADGW